MAEEEVGDSTRGSIRQAIFFEFCNLWPQRIGIKRTQILVFVIDEEEHSDSASAYLTDRWLPWTIFLLLLQ